MNGLRNILVEWSCGGRIFKMEVFEASEAAAIAKVKAVVLALAHSNALMRSDCFEVVSGFDEDYA